MPHELIKFHEGRRLKPYRCSAGKLTIGYGLNLDAGITQYEAEWLLDHRVKRCREKLQKIFTPEDFTAMGGNRIDAFTDMVYNLGYKGFSKFKDTIRHARAENWDKCAAEMINSKWAMQVGYRATRLAKIIRTGVMPKRFQ